MNAYPDRAGGTAPDWKLFLDLGERLLEQATALDQCTLIAAAVDNRLASNTQIWLCSPHYPLPGQPEVETLPSAQCPELVQKTYNTRRPNAREGRASAIKTDPVQEIAVPMLARDHLLGVIYVRRKGTRHFRSEDLEFLEALAGHSAISLEATRQFVIKKWHTDQLALVRSVNLQIASVRDIHEMCSRVVRLIQETFNYYYVSIFTLSADRQSLYLEACASPEEVANPPCGFILQLGEGIAGNVAQTGLELVVPDVELEPVYRHLDGLPETRSEAVFPLKLDGQILGVLDVESNLLDAFHETDTLVLRALADNIALALQQIHLYRQVKRHDDQISTVYEISRALTSILEIDLLLEEVVELIQRRLGYPFVHIFTVHPGRRKIIYRMGTGERAQAMQDNLMAYNLDEPVGMIPWVARTGKIRVANQVELDPLYVPSVLPPANTRAEMSVPLMIGTEVLGVLDIQSDSPGVFSEEVVSMFSALAAPIAVAIRNASLYRSERWRRQAADSFRDVAGLITSNVEIEKLLDVILSQLERNLPCVASAIWLIDHSESSLSAMEGGLAPVNPEVAAEPRDLRLAAVHGVEPETVDEAISHSPSAAAWLEAARISAVPVIRTPSDPIGPLGLALHCPPDYSSLAVPLIAGDQTLGLVVLAHPTAGRYGSEARDMTITFASYAAVAIQNARLFSDAQSQAWISTVLLQVAESGQTITSVDDLTASMVRLTPMLVGVQKCAVFLWDDSRECFFLKDHYGFELAKDEPHYLEEQDAPGLTQLRSALAPIFLESAADDLNLPEADLPDATLVLLPLLAHGTLLGAFLVTHQVTGLLGVRMPLTPQTLSILQGIAHQTALTLENLRLIEARQEESYVTAVMLQVAQAVASQNQLDDILDTIVHLMPILVGIDTCVIYQWDDTLQDFYAAQAQAPTRAEEERLINRTYRKGEFELLDRTFQNQPTFCPLGKADLSSEEWPDLFCLSAEEFRSVSRFTTSSWLMAFPLSVKGETFGVMLAKENHANPTFRDRRVEIISGIAQQVALAIQNDYLNDEMVNRERMEREIQLAREIQQTFLPNHLPSAHGWELDARWQTARTVGGDFYDVFRIGRKKLALVIADVSDKGMAAALYMTVTRTLIRATTSSHSGSQSPAAVFDRVNNQLSADSQNGMFVTSIIGYLDVETGRLVYANAGHNRPLIYRAKTGLVERLEKGGMALAVIEENHYVDHVIDLAPDDCLLFYTDGVTENFAPDGEAFGEERLAQIVQTTASRGVVQLLGHLDDVLAEFREGAAPSDDVTFLAVRRLRSE